jgi:ABC-type nitrate/sulfonate/bicarbonate transport system substrate-binding protein
MTVALTYGVPTDRSGIAIRFGIARGFFRDEGIDLSVRVVYGGPEIAAEYDRGSLSIGELGTPPGITAIAKGHRFRIIGSGNPRGGGMFFLVRPDIDDWSGLQGHTVAALSLGSCSYWYLRQLLLQHGLDPDRDERPSAAEPGADCVMRRKLPALPDRAGGHRAWVAPACRSRLRPWRDARWGRAVPVA